MRKITKISELAVDHPYYANMGNYYSNDPYTEYDSWNDFAYYFMEADIDYNLCYRWDVKKHEESGEGYYMEVALILQRKGIYMPKLIRSVTDNDVPGIIKYLKKHHAQMKELWLPFA